MNIAHLTLVSFCLVFGLLRARKVHLQSRHKIFRHKHSTTKINSALYDFSYEDDNAGPDKWPALFRECDGSKQSPINIEMTDLRKLHAPPLKWSPSYFKIPKCMSLLNNDHRLILRVKYPVDRHPKLSSGPLHKKYLFKEIAFHWGSTNTNGSEHTIDKFSYPMEMQVIHTSDGDSENGDYVIVAYFFQIGRKNCSSIDKILQVFTEAVRYRNRPVGLKHLFSLSSLIRPFSSEYVSYFGSLTSPPCTEGVQWIVYPFPLKISMYQLNQFRCNVRKYARDLVNNYRPIQPLNNRLVFFIT